MSKHCPSCGRKIASMKELVGKGVCDEKARLRRMTFIERIARNEGLTLEELSSLPDSVSLRLPGFGVKMLADLRKLYPKA